MNERVIRARRIINLMFLFLLIMTLIGDALQFKYGIFNGIYKTILSLTPITASFFMTESITKGEKNSREKMSFFLLLGIALAVFFMITNKVFTMASVVVLIIASAYLAFVLYLFMSKDMRNLFSYTEAVRSLKWLWSWKGICIGYKKDDYLWSYNGDNIGRFIGNEIYSPEGKYLGEIYSNGRLAIDKSKIDKLNKPYERLSTAESYEKPSDTSGMAIYPNYLDFSIN